MNSLNSNQSTTPQKTLSIDYSTTLEDNFHGIQEIFILDAKSFLPKFLIAFLSIWLFSEITEINLFYTNNRVEVYSIQNPNAIAIDNATKYATFETKKKNFMVKKHLLISEYLIKNGIPTTAQLSEKEATSLNIELNDLFIQYLIKNNPDMSETEKEFFTDSKFNIVLNALNEQWENHIPFSILIAKTISSTNYGKENSGNNLFSIKNDKGNLKYYDSSADSFDDFSNQLISKIEYANLFVGGKNYVHWANQINTYDCNEKDYAVFQSSCGQILINIISELNLDLLDY
ncbi:MAG: glucosaminidase domain-containing protein [Flammeovirgaceae bacterium]|nr:glucosaminidase domain-containing protein [Flammeovirgaceae bacterium]